MQTMILTQHEWDWADAFACGEFAGRSDVATRRWLICLWQHRPGFLEGLEFASCCANS